MKKLKRELLHHPIARASCGLPRSTTQTSPGLPLASPLSEAESLSSACYARRMKARTLTVSFAEPRQIDLQQQQQQQAMPEPVKVRCCGERIACPVCDLLCCHSPSGPTGLSRGIPKLGVY